VDENLQCVTALEGQTVDSTSNHSIKNSGNLAAGGVEDILDEVVNLSSGNE
jgi:hypothetical protein